MNLLIFKWSANYKSVRFADHDGGIKLRESRLFLSREAAEASVAGKTTSRSQQMPAYNMKEGNQMKDQYYEQAVACVKDRVLPAQMELYRSCSGDLDRIYGEAMNGNGYFGKVIVPGHVYELGYEKCTCPKVLSGQITDPDHCNCSRQSILYILSQQEPDSEFEVDILETVLNGAEHCRFRITKK